MDTTSADNLTDGQWGVSDPRVSALGRSRRAKGEGRSRPSPPHRHIGALTAGSKERCPLDIDERANPVRHQQFAYAGRGENRKQGRPLQSLTRLAEGDRCSRELHPPDLRSSASDLPRKNKEMLVGMRQLQALDARAATVQGVTRNR